MTKRNFSLLIIVLLAASRLLAADYLQGRVIVRFKDAVHKQTAKSMKGPVANKAVLDAIAKSVLPTVQTLMDYERDEQLGVLRLPAGVSVEEAINQYYISGLVDYAEPDYLRKLMVSSTPLVVPDDYTPATRWDLERMEAPQAWDYSTGSYDVRVAVIDTGLAYLHPDFYEAFPAGFENGSTIDPGNSNFVWDLGQNDQGEDTYNLLGIDTAGANIEQDNPDYDPLDAGSHGTHVAGIIGAYGDNSIGTVGVNWRVSLLPVKVFADDSPDSAANSHIIAGIYWAIDNNADIVNMSIGGGAYSQFEYNALQTARNAGVVVVAAAGNDSSNNDGRPVYPASYGLDNIISVMSTNISDDVATYSNYGASTVDIAAPGSGIYSTIPGHPDYGTMSGTSMAAPQVAGAMALIKSFIDAGGAAADADCLWPAGQVPLKVIELLYYSTDKLPSLAGLCVSEGRLNLYSIMKVLAGAGVILNDGTTPSAPFIRTHDTIADAIAAANSGDTIWLYNNHWYFENIDIVGIDLNFKIVDTEPEQPNLAYITLDECYPANDWDAPLLRVDGATVDFEGEIYFERATTSAIRLENNADLTLKESILRNNFAANGSSVYAEQSVLRLSECQIYDNSASSYGGAIYLSSSDLEVNTPGLVAHDPEEMVLSNNAAGLDGGVIYAVGGGFIDVSKSSFEFNTAGSSGGAIAIEDGFLIVSGDSSFIRNTAFYDGGAVYGDNSYLDFTETVFRANETTGATFPPYGGGAIYCGNSEGLSGELQISKVNFISNKAASDGGAVLVDGAVCVIDEAVFVGGVCLGDGGAAFIRDTQSAAITNSIVTNNSSELFGGGISIHSSKVDLRNLLIYENSSNWWGGAVYIYGKSQTYITESTKSEITITNCTIDNNTCSVFGGGVYMNDNGQTDAAKNNKLVLTNNIFTNNANYAVYEAGGLSTLESNNCLYYRNLDGDVYYKGAFMLFGSTPIKTFLGSSNLYADPMYVPGYPGEFYGGVTYSGQYYLSHTDAGQVLDAGGNIAADQGTSATSPCYNKGFNLASNLFLDDKSARTDGVFDTGVADIGYHYSDINAPYLPSENVVINISPVKGGIASPDSTVLFKPYSQVVLEANSKVGYIFKHWTNAQGNKLTEITSRNPNGDYYALYDSNGRLMYLENGVEGVPSKIVIILNSSKTFNAVFEEAVATLRIRVTGGNGTIYQGASPNDLQSIPIAQYARGQVVHLKAEPTYAQHKIEWDGTLNDASLARTNTVKLTENFQDVSVRFYQPQTWTVGPQSDTNFDSLRQALTNPNLNPGDIITIMPGEHEFTENNNPDDPTVVITVDKPVVIQGGSTGNPEATVIKNGIMVFTANVRENTIVRDITFQGHNYHSDGWGWNGCTTPENPYPDGDHGPSGGGAIMRMNSYYSAAQGRFIGASPTIINCRFLDATYRVASGKHGCVQNEIRGDGGWPGIVYGGAIRIGNFANPVFDNCEFINLQVQGGHGGNAADRAMPGLWGDPTASWWPYIGRTNMLPGFVDEEDITESHAFRFVLPHEKKEYFPAQEEKNQYAGRGGAIYIGIGAKPVIRNSRFEGCSAMSGSSGVSNVEGAPTQHYRIPSYGGAVFCDAMSEPVFENVEFVNNIAHWEQPTTHPDGGAVVSTNDYQSSGGAVYAQRNSRPEFINCYFEGNQAVVGGAIAVDNIGYVDENDSVKSMIIEDCRFVGNSSDIGGAVVITGGADSKTRYLSSISYDTSFYGTITFNFDYPGMNEVVSKSAGFGMLVRSDFVGNQAIIQLDGELEQVGGDGELVDLISQDAFAKSGHGGAIAAYSAFTELNDCQFHENMSGGFGGAIYVSGKNIHTGLPYDGYNSMYLRNCLIASNYAGLGGGGVNITTHSDPHFNNCTIADNAVTAAGGKGGGVLISDVSTATIQNSILYGNICSNGSQIALVEAHAGEPSSANVRYSLVEPYIEEPPFIDTGLAAIRTINDQYDDYTITVNLDNDYYELPALANTVSNWIDIGFTINFYGLTANRIYVSDNGLVSFWQPITGFSEYVLSSNFQTPVIAPFHADIDSSRGNTVFYGRGTIITEESGIYKERRVFFVNYIDVGYFSQRQDKLNSFQLVLIERDDNDFDIEFNYDKIQWEAGENQGGTNGIGGTTARVGFSKGTGIPGTFYELEGTGVRGAFLDDATTALIARNRNSNAIGRLVFPVREGQPLIRFGSPVYAEGSSSINYNRDMNKWVGASNVKTADPLWALPGLYYLSEPDTGDPDQIEMGRSPCIDAGFGEARDNYIFRHTTRTDNELDANRVDIGFHYTLPTTDGLVGDFNFDGIIVADEWLWISELWLSECYYPYWCFGADINRDGIVNQIDVVSMSPVGTRDTIAPQPILGEDGLSRDVDFSSGENMRMTWEQKPVSAGSGQNAIKMRASKAIDNCIGKVEYGFQRTYPLNMPLAGADADGILWQSDDDATIEDARSFVDAGLIIDQEYGYRCYARDVHGNKTLASLAVRTVAGDDSQAPTWDGNPDSSTKGRWLVTPETASVVGNVASIRMVAQTAIDPENNGVQYFFECTGGGGHNSVWQDSPEYVDTGLEVGVLYTYRVKTRDKSRNFNEGQWSDEASALTSAVSIVDRDKPEPMPYINAIDVDYRNGLFQDNMWHRITARAVSTDASGPVWYKFVCVTNSKFSSPRIYQTGALEEGYQIDTTKFRYLMGDGSITWEANVGFPSRTESWKVICGDSAEPENAYTLAEQPQRVTLGAMISDLDLDNVEFFTPPAEDDQQGGDE